MIFKLASLIIFLFISTNSFAGFFNRPPDLSGFNDGYEEGIQSSQSLIDTMERGRENARYIKARDAFSAAYATHDPNEILRVVGQYSEYADWGRQLIEAQQEMQERMNNQ